MKKLYSFLASAVVAAGVNAAMPAKVAADRVGDITYGDITNVKPVDVKLTKSDKQLNFKKHSSVNPLVFKESKGNSRVNKVLPDGGYNWETIGEADYYDAITVAPLADYGVPVQNFKVEIQESQTQPGIYRMVNIHDNNPNVGDMGLSLADPNVDSYMIFNTLDGGPVITEAEYNLLDPFTYENKYVISQTDFGSFENKVAVIPAGAIAVGLGIEPWNVLEFYENYKPVIPSEYSETVFMTQEDLVIVLPGGTYTPDTGADYSFELLQLNMCANDDNIALIGFEGGEDIKSYKWEAIPGRYLATAGNLKIIAEDGRDIEQGIYNIGLGNEAGWFSIFVVGLNDAGEVAAGDVLYFYNFAHNPEDWTSIGNVQFTDDTFGPVYGIDDAIAPIKVEMLESKTTPGLYRLVNPYATHKLAEEYEELIECHFDHNHYIDIDASDIENVTISEVPIGITIYGEEHITLFSNEPGTLVDNKITFPKRGLGVGIFGGEEEGYYYANHAARFAVELPCTLNVKAFDTNDNPVEGAYVYAGSSEAVTDEKGEAKMELYGVIGKTVAVTVMKDYMFWEGTADFTEGETAYVFPVLEEPACTLTVRAVTADYDPVEGAYVMVNGEEKVTGENGAATFTLEGVIGKTLPVTVMKDYMFWEGTADFTEGMEATVIAILEEPACTLTVRAVTADYDPVEGAYVMVNGEEKVTGENGAATFTLEGVIGKTLPVTVMKDYMFWEGTADFTEGMEATVIAILANPDCTLKVSVIDEEGEPVVDATVIANGQEGTTNEYGLATLEVGDVIGTKISVKVTKEGYEDGEAEADFTESMEHHAVVTLKAKTVGLSLAIIDGNKDIKVYDLNGRRIEHPSAGNIYIIDGKKVRIVE